MKMKSIGTFETSGRTNPKTRRHIPEHSTIPLCKPQMSSLTLLGDVGAKKLHCNAGVTSVKTSTAQFIVMNAGEKKNRWVSCRSDGHLHNSVGNEGGAGCSLALHPWN